MLPIIDVLQRPTPTPFPTPAATPWIQVEFAPSIGNDITDMAVQTWNQWNSTGMITTIQAVVVVLLLLGCITAVVLALRSIE